MISYNKQRLKIYIEGYVQGVGFRPFIYQLAVELGLTGWICNSGQGVEIEVEGSKKALDLFVEHIHQEKPSLSSIQRLDLSYIHPINETNFTILPSKDSTKIANILPDIATCSDCLQELFDSTNHRYRYPFITCTNCGPRFSCVQALPYDRSNTTMKEFQMCSQCQTEYNTPTNRRFHSQSNACSQCGPQIALWNSDGEAIGIQDEAINLTVTAIRQGKIVAIKGLGGFHLIADSYNKNTIQRLRQAKQRISKPFALMYPSTQLIKDHCEVSEQEIELLQSSAAPIVLLRRKVSPVTTNYPLPDSSVTPDNPYLGIMLPYTPLHYLLIQRLNYPVIATSGNLVNESICIDESEVIQRLGAIADLFLVHNRTIACPVDDSIARILMGKINIIRRARGYTPVSIPIPAKNQSFIFNKSYFALGGHQKNTIAFQVQHNIILSQHIGDLSTDVTIKSFQDINHHFQQIYELNPKNIICDDHPDYYSTQFAYQQAASSLNKSVIPVQHHYAHILACMAEHQLSGPALGIAWDGSGYGTDGTIWGGEFLKITPTYFKRIAHFKPFLLPGGNTAIKEPKRSAIGLLFTLFGNQVFNIKAANFLEEFSSQDINNFKVILNNHINTVMTSSVGRVFDGISSILGLCKYIDFEGQAAMNLEFLIENLQTDDFYPFDIKVENIVNKPQIIDWSNMLRAILSDYSKNASPQLISAKFHNTLVEIIIAIAKQIKENKVILSGGCFQNKYLLERAVRKLKDGGFAPYWHQQIPTHDGGISLGQIMSLIRQDSRNN